MSASQIIDLLERAYEAGGFPEVLKMIKAGSEPALIEVVIKKSMDRLNDGYPFDWNDIFGGD